MNTGKDTIQRWFPTEFIGRVKELGQIYTFKPFDLKSQQQLLSMLLHRCEEKHRLTIKITHEAESFLLSQSEIITLGARGLKNVIEKVLEKEIEKFCSKSGQNHTITIRLKNNQLTVKEIKKRSSICRCKAK